MPFVDRVDAGRRLAAALRPLTRADCVIAGLPRGGVVVAAAVAAELSVPLDLIVVRKLGVPVQPELAMGAIGEGDVTILNHDIIRAVGVSDEQLAAVHDRERGELERRVHRFRGDREPISLAGKTVIIVDDGVATGSTALAACKVARAQGATAVVLAVPVAPVGFDSVVRRDADEFVCLEQPEPFIAVGCHYADFSPTSDREVVDLLRHRQF